MNLGAKCQEILNARILQRIMSIIISALIKGFWKGGLTQGSNLWGGDVELGGLEASPTPGKF